MYLVPSDVQQWGTISGRTSGLITTLPNPKEKKPNKLGTGIKTFLSEAPAGYKFVSFDFSALELVIAAAMNSLEQCNKAWQDPDPMASEAAQLVFAGDSKKGTDVHTVMAKKIAIPRPTVKTLEYSPVGKECLVNVLGKGWISIAEVQEGDQVEAQDLNADKRVWVNVLKTMSYSNFDAIKVKVGKLEFVTTNCHRWPAFDARTKEFKCYKRTDELTGEDCLRTEDEARLLGWQRVQIEPVIEDVYCISTPTTNFWTKICDKQVLTGNSLYGSGISGLESVLRPELPALSDKELNTTCVNFQTEFKGTKIPYTQYWKDGLFSHFFNYANDLINQAVPTLPFLKTQITTALRPNAVGKDFRTSRMNWCVQASGGELHDTVLVLANKKASAAGFEPSDWRFYASCHD